MDHGIHPDSLENDEEEEEEEEEEEDKPGESSFYHPHIINCPYLCQWFALLYFLIYIPVLYIDVLYLRTSH